MKLVWACFFLSLTIINSLLGEETNVSEEHESSVAAFEGLPSNIVNGHVCAITGEFIDNTVDLILPGPETFVFSRSYSSNDRKGNHGIGWNSNHRDTINFTLEKLNGDNVHFCHLKEPSGANLSYTTEYHKDNKYDPILHFKLRKPKGLSNGSGKGISGRTNLKNQKVNFEFKDECFHCVNGAGNKRIFSFSHLGNGGRLFTQIKENKINGSSYEYESEVGLPFSVKSIKCLNTENRKLFSEVKLSSPKDNFFDTFTLKLEASDEREITYKYFKHKRTRYLPNEKIRYYEIYLREVESGHKPREKYSYEEKKGLDQGLHLKKKILPNNRYIETSYYQRGENDLGSKLGTIHLNYINDYRVDRIKYLIAPAGTTEKPLVINRFIYEINKKENNGVTEYLDGHTYVYDAHHHQTKYSYDKEHRLTSLKKYTGHESYKDYSTEKYVWGKERSSNEGNLLGKYLVDAHGNIHHYQQYKYDDAGNIIESRFFGNLTGRHNSQIELNDEHLPIKSKCEYESKHCSYSENGLNLLKEEVDSNHTKTSYRHKPGTDLVISRHVSFEDEFQTREFFEYNEHNVVSRKIIDDGKEYGKNNLTGVTERHITTYQTRSKKPVGLVERLDEYYLDLNTNEEVLLGSILYEYTKQGFVTKEEHLDENGKSRFSKYWEYDTHGNVTKEVNPLGETIIKQYDENDNLIYQQGPHPDFYIKNSYDFMNRLIQQEEIHNDGKRFVTAHAYDPLGNCRSTINPYGHETKYKFDSFGREISMHLAPVEDENGILSYPETSKKYDIAGYPISLIDPMGNETKFEYNVRGKPIHITFPDGTEEFYYYRLDGKLQKKVEKNGVFTIYKLDNQGRILKESIYSTDKQMIKTQSWTYNAFHVTSHTDAEGLLTNFHYDFAGRLVKTQKDRQVQEYTYDALGNLTVTKEWYGSTELEYRLICKEYDLLNRVIQEQVVSPEGQIMAFSSFMYDCNGNKILEKNAEEITYTEYNAQNNPTKITNVLGHSTYAEYNTNFVNEHNQIVLQTTFTDALGNLTVETYDTGNRLVQILKKNAFGIETAGQKIYYDLCGNKVKVVDQVYVDEKIIKEQVTEFAYTVNNDIAKIVEAVGTPEQKMTVFDYNVWGQKTLKIKPDGIQLHYTYDDCNQLKSLKSSDGSIAYLYAYDKNGQITEILDEVHQLTSRRHYNLLGELESEEQGHGLVINYAYDHVGQLKEIALPDGSSIEYEYDSVNLIGVHRVKADKRVYSHYDLDHNLDGSATKSRLADQKTTIDYKFDSMGRCTSMIHPQLSQTISKEGFDAVGNLLSYQSQGANYEFKYDDLYQLKSEKGHAQHAYRYDSLSNRLSKDEEMYDVNHLNQLNARGEEKFQYDANGNLISRELENKQTFYAYDALDRLILVKQHEQEIKYFYDGFDRRLKKQMGEKEQNFIYAGQDEIGMIENGKTVELKIISKGSRSPAVALEFDGKLHIPIYDLFGHVGCLNDSEGNLVERYQYTAFGEVEITDADGTKVKDSKVGNPWMYANRRLDKETGLVAFGLRYYDPLIGRWTTADPAGFDDGSNLYAYVHNNPMVHLDQFGLFTQDMSPTNIFEAPPINFPFTMLSYMARDITKAVPMQRSYDSKVPAIPPTIDNFETNVPRNFGDSGIYNMNDDFCDGATGERYNFAEYDKIKFSFMNGVGNNMESFSTSLLHLCKITGANVHAVFDKTQGFKQDAEHYYNAQYRCIAYDPSRNLQRLWYKTFSESPSDSIIIHFPHSYGGVTTRNALMSFPPELRKRIFVIAIGTGGFIHPSLCGGVIHLWSKRDFVPALDWVNALKNRNTIVFLNPAPNAGWFDHTVISPTYVHKISTKTDFLIQKYK